MAITAHRMKLVSKPQAIIISNKIVRSSHKLSLIQQKIFFQAVRGLQEKENYKDDRSRTVELNIADLKKEGAIKDSNIYQIVEDETANIGRLDLFIKYTPENVKRIFFLATIEAKNGILSVKFTKDAMPYLIELKRNFTLYPMDQLMAMRSTYGLRFYQMLFSFADTGYMTITVNELRERLQLQDKYENFTHFRRYVLKQAQKDIHQNTNLRFSWSEFKQGRRIHRLYFEIFTKDKAPKELKSKEGDLTQQQDLFPDQQIWRDRLKNLYHVKDKQIDDIFTLINSDNYKTFTRTFHEMEIERTNGQIHRLPGFAIAMLVNNLKEE
jgi:plasmid replication initiation protein